MKKIFDIKEITVKEKIALGIICIILPVIGTAIIKNLIKKRYNYNIDYSKENIENLFEYSNSTNDREIYWILNNIIDGFIKSYSLELSGIVKTDDGLYSREDFYATLSDEYKKVLNKSKYMEVSENMLKKFVEKDNTMKDEDYIAEVRYLNSNRYAENMYICKLNTVDENVNSYIGIIINPSNRFYNIFYLE